MSSFYKCNVYFSSQCAASTRTHTHTHTKTYVEGLRGAPPPPRGNDSLMGAPLFFRSSTADLITSVQLQTSNKHNILILPLASFPPQHISVRYLHFSLSNRLSHQLVDLGAAIPGEYHIEGLSICQEWQEKNKQTKQKINGNQKARHNPDDRNNQFSYLFFFFKRVLLTCSHLTQKDRVQLDNWAQHLLALLHSNVALALAL